MHSDSTHIVRKHKRIPLRVAHAAHHSLWLAIRFSETEIGSENRARDLCPLLGILHRLLRLERVGPAGRREGRADLHRRRRVEDRRAGGLLGVHRCFAREPQAGQPQGARMQKRAVGQPVAGVGEIADDRMGVMCRVQS